VVDSSTIEARLLDWIAGQDDMVEVYRKQDNKTGPDMYCVIATHIYGFQVNKTDHPDERQMGKRTKLGLGFGMGELQFIVSVRREAKDKNGKPLILDPAFAKRVVQDVYRALHKQVVKFWRRCENALQAIAAGQVGVDVDFRGIVKTCKDGLIMPNGLKILYPDLKFEPERDEKGDPIKNRWGKVVGEWTFWNGRAREKIYGAKVCENIIQCLARIIVFNQCLMAVKECEARRYPMKWKHSVHDEGVFIAPTFFAPVVQEVAERCFRTPLDWCQSLPLNCEGGIHQRYGLAKK
jgi:DNA polymerase